MRWNARLGERARWLQSDFAVLPFASGAFDYVLKPFDIPNMLALIRQADAVYYPASFYAELAAVGLAAVAGMWFARLWFPLGPVVLAQAAQYGLTLVFKNRMTNRALNELRLRAGAQRPPQPPDLPDREP